jgi:hypothetical protein
MWANNELVNGVIRDFCETDSLADKPTSPPPSVPERKARLL